MAGQLPTTDEVTVKGGYGLHALLLDLRYALRILAKSPAFTIVSILTLALGIGANTAMFSVVDGVLLRPLPFQDPQRLVALGEFDTRTGRTSTQGSLSYPDLMDVRARNHSFAAVAAFNSNNPLTLTGAGQALHVKVQTVSSNLFSLLGAQPWLGRTFMAGEDDPGHHVVVLSEAFWRRQFQSDPGVIGRAVELSGRSYTIVGVMPRGFQFPVEAEAVELWVTFSQDAEVEHAEDPSDTSATAQRGNHYLTGIARLKPGVTVERANADLAAIARANRRWRAQP